MSFIFIIQVRGREAFLPSNDHTLIETKMRQGKKVERETKTCFQSKYFTTLDACGAGNYAFSWDSSCDASTSHCPSCPSCPSRPSAARGSPSCTYQSPFVVVMPCSTLTTRYFRDLFQDIQVIVPRRRIQFRKLVDGVEVPSGRCSFDCLYFCWRLGLPGDVVFLT